MSETSTNLNKMDYAMMIGYIALPLGYEIFNYYNPNKLNAGTLTKPHNQVSYNDILSKTSIIAAGLYCYTTNTHPGTIKHL